MQRRKPGQPHRKWKDAARQTKLRRSTFVDEIEAMMEELAKRHGKEGMRAIATLMHDLGSSATIYFCDDTWIPYDFLMQIAWKNGGSPEPEAMKYKA